MRLHRRRPRNSEWAVRVGRAVADAPRREVWWRRTVTRSGGHLLHSQRSHSQTTPISATHGTSSAVERKENAHDARALRDAATDTALGGSVSSARREIDSINPEATEKAGRANRQTNKPHTTDLSSFFSFCVLPSC